MNRVGLHQFKKYRIMNKTYKSGMMALSAVVFLTSCSENESLQQAHLSTDQINFIASMAHQWDANTKSAPQNPSSRSAGVRDNEAPIHVNANLAKPLYLHPVVQDGIHIWSKQGTPITRSGAPIEDVEQERVVQTRGIKKDNLSAYSTFGVTALYQNGDDYVSLFDNATATNSGKYWNIPDASNNTWPIDSKVFFHAYAPHSSESNKMLSSKPDPTNVQTNIHYTASSDYIVDQPDLIVATNAEKRSKTAANTPVDLQFSHALTAVSFAMSSDLADVIGNGAQLTSVSLQNIPNEGDCQLIAQDDKHSSSSAIWKLDSDKTGTYTFDLSGKNITVGSDLALTDDNKTLMMIPQTLPDGAKLVFTFKLNGQPQVLTVDLDGQKWDAGKSVIYKLSAKAINTLDATDVTYPSTWTASSFPKESFTTNDAIGLYVVDKNNHIVESNVKLTLGSNSKWTTDKKFLKLAGYKYFAYYPYSATKAPAVTTADAANADKKTATEFFASTISNWNPAKDQREELLLPQDLQVAKGVVAGDASTLTFPMEHSMGLAVLNLTSKEIAMTRRFKNNSYTYYYPNLDGRVEIEPTEGKDYTNDAAKQSVSASTAFSGYIPYTTSTANRYIQIVKPSTDISFKASDESGKPRSAWGTLTPCTFNVAKNAVMSKEIKTDADFYYLARVYTCTQSVETSKTAFIAPTNTEYILECWGGGSNVAVNYSGTIFPGVNGGYSKGKMVMSNNQTIYMVVGGGGASNNGLLGGNGGYNGGGNGAKGSKYAGGAGGGGATHIANKSCLLKDLSTNDLIIVAGGAGGTAVNGRSNGYGGGQNGGSTTTAGNPHNIGSISLAGASQAKGYSFGQGQNAPEKTAGGAWGDEGCGGGGGGLYGGYAYLGNGPGSCCAGSGGSGYVGNINIKDGITKQNVESPSGNYNGYASVSWILKE